MTRAEIEELLSAMAIESTVVNKCAFHINFQNETLRVEFVVPFNVLELYIDAFDFENKKLYSQWFDYYGKDAVQDFKEDLRDFLAILRDSPVRHSSQNKCLECCLSGVWKKFA